MERRRNPVFRALNAPLTLMGAEKKLLFLALVMGAAVFNLLHTFLGGILMFSLLYWFARWAHPMHKTMRPRRKFRCRSTPCTRHRDLQSISGFVFVPNLVPRPSWRCALLPSA